MSNSRAGALTVCPFFLSDSKQAITCEGLSAGSKTMLIFKNVQQRQEWQEKNCFLYHCTCPLKNLINEKYD